MSGFFKSFDKFIKLEQLAQPNNFLIRQDRVRFNIANLYFNNSLKQVGLQKDHPYSPISLASISAALIYEAQQFQKIRDITPQVQNEINANYQLSKQLVEEAIRLIKADRWAKEVEVNASLLYAIRYNPELKVVQTGVLLDNILENSQYLSTQNIVDIVDGLRDYRNPSFWTQFFQLIKNKQFEWDLQTADYHGWKFSQYDTFDGEYKEGISSTQSIIRRLESESIYDEISRLIYDARLFTLTAFWYPFFHREKRITYIFDERRPKKSTYFDALKEIKINNPELNI